MFGHQTPMILNCNDTTGFDINDDKEQGIGRRNQLKENREEKIFLNANYPYPEIRLVIDKILC